MRVLGLTAAALLLLLVTVGSANAVKRYIGEARSVSPIDFDNRNWTYGGDQPVLTLAATRLKPGQTVRYKACWQKRQKRKWICKRASVNYNQSANRTLMPPLKYRWFRNEKGKPGDLRPRYQVIKVRFIVKKKVVARDKLYLWE